MKKYLLIILPAALRWFVIFFCIIVLLPESFYIVGIGGPWAQFAVLFLWMSVAWNALVAPSLFAVLALYRAIIETHKTDIAKAARAAISKKVLKKILQNNKN